MFEFPMTAPESNDFESGLRSAYTIRRLKQLAALATRLTKAGWPVWLTMTGLAFEAPGVDDLDWDDPDEREQEATALLALLGVNEPFHCWSGRIVPELPDGWADWMWEPR